MSVLLLVIVVSRPQLIAFISNGAVSALPGSPQVLGQSFSATWLVWARTQEFQLHLPLSACVGSWTTGRRGPRTADSCTPGRMLLVRKDAFSRGARS
jgi:hypothetical protein